MTHVLAYLAVFAAGWFGRDALLVVKGYRIMRGRGFTLRDVYRMERTRREAARR
jgi:hypothetical protein